MDAQIAVFDDGTISIDGIKLASRSAGEVDVAISLAAICGSDLHTVLGHRDAPAHTVLGHEGVGRITGVDEGTRDLRGEPLERGDRVIFALFWACGACDRCAQGLTMKCRSLLKFGHESVATPPHATGTLASHVRLPPELPVIRVPDHLTDVQAVSAGCAVATASAIVHSARGPVNEDARVLVYGAGSMGIFTIAMLAALGCSVYVSEPSAERRRLAIAVGARPVEDDVEPFPVVVEASGSSVAFAEAIDRADIGGQIIAAGSVSPGNTAATVDPATLVTRRLTITGVHNYTVDDFRWGVEWLFEHAGQLDLQGTVSPPFPLTEISSAFEEMRSGKYLRVLVRPKHDYHGS